MIHEKKDTRAQDVDVKNSIRSYLNFDVDVLKHAFFPWIITFVSLSFALAKLCQGINCDLKHIEIISFAFVRILRKFIENKVSIPVQRYMSTVLTQFENQEGCTSAADLDLVTALR